MIRHIFYYFYKNTIQRYKLESKRTLHQDKVFDGWVRAYLTLRCNLKCPYCVNEFVKEEGLAHEFETIDSAGWIGLINKIGRNVIITGGEPFIYPYLAEVLNGVESNLKVKVYTNFTVNPSHFVKKVKRPVHFFGSYHPCAGDHETIINNMAILKGAGFSVEIHSILSDLRLKDYRRVAPDFAKKGIRLGLEVDQSEIFESSSKKFRARVKCTREIILVAPDGVRYPCVSRMIRRVGGLEDLTKMPLARDRIVCTCDDYGFCAPCDGLGVFKVEHV